MSALKKNVIIIRVAPNYYSRRVSLKRIKTLKLRLGIKRRKTAHFLWYAEPSERLLTLIIVSGIRHRLKLNSIPRKPYQRFFSYV